MRHLIPALFVMSLMLAACGGGTGDSSSGASNSASPSASASASSVDTGTGNGDGGYGEGGGSTGTGGIDDTAGTITISDFAYGAPLTVAPGTLVAVVNEDSQEHSATAEDGSFDTGLFGQGEQVTLTAPSEAGTYNITCTAHAQMAGQLIVSG